MGREGEKEFIAIGRIVGVHGIRGEFRVFPLSDRKERWEKLFRVFVADEQERGGWFEVEKVSRVASGLIRLKLKGVDDRTRAEEFKGYYLYIPREFLWPLSEGQFYRFELIGLTVVTSSGQYVGKVKEVLALPAQDVIVVESNEKEIWVPLARVLVPHIDIHRGVLVVNPIEGLLDPI